MQHIGSHCEGHFSCCFGEFCQLAIRDIRDAANGHLPANRARTPEDWFRLLASEIINTEEGREHFPYHLEPFHRAGDCGEPSIRARFMAYLFRAPAKSRTACRVAVFGI
jgi:hypothetical protein